MEKIKCPNCGGYSSNYLNCDYCESFMVRFERHGITIDSSNANFSEVIIQEMQEKLKANIDEQINTHSSNRICTTISANGRDIQVMNPRALNEPLKIGRKLYIYPCSPFDESEIGLVLVLVFDEKDSLDDNTLVDRDSINYNFSQMQKFEWFCHNGLDKLFINYDSAITNTLGFTVGTRHYHYLNFGKDISGATMVILQYLFGNKIVDKTSKIRYLHTSIDEYDAIYKRQKIEKERRWYKYLLYLLCLGLICLVFYDYFEGLFLLLTLLIVIIFCCGLQSVKRRIAKNILLGREISTMSILKSFVTK